MQVPGAGRKWWEDATLTTEAGAQTAADVPLLADRYAVGASKAELTVRLETATALLWRGVLLASNPVHRALLTQHDVPQDTIRAVAESQARAAAAAAASAAQPASSAARAGSESPVLVVPARAVKRELIDLSQQQPPSQRSRTAVPAEPVKRELVDLT